MGGGKALPRLMYRCLSDDILPRQGTNVQSVRKPCRRSISLGVSRLTDMCVSLFSIRMVLPVWSPQLVPMAGATGATVLLNLSYTKCPTPRASSGRIFQLPRRRHSPVLDAASSQSAPLSGELQPKPWGSSNTFAAQVQSREWLTTKRRWRRWGRPKWTADNILQQAALLGPATIPQQGHRRRSSGGTNGASAPTSLARKHPKALSPVLRRPGTFSQIIQVGLIPSHASTNFMSSLPQASARDCLLPAVLKAGQGGPPMTSSALSLYLAQSTLVISPRFGTLGNLSARTADWNGSISEKDRHSQPRGSKAMASLPRPVKREMYRMVLSC